MEDPKRRADKWRAKFDTERVKQTLDGMREGMADRYRRQRPNWWRWS